MRSFADPDQEPLLWASTYQVAALSVEPSADPSKAAVQGYLTQAEAVMGHVDKLIAAAERRKESLVVEGVHLSPAFATQLMRKRPSVVPFLVHISNEAKHLERFAVRAKAMTLRPEGNRYVRHLRAIRDIQDHLCAAADTRAVPKVDNTNVDRSVATIHATVLGCLRRKSIGDSLIDLKTGRCTVLLEEYLGCKNATWSGSDMLELIRGKVAAGEAVSPTEGPSTSAASTSVAGGAAGGEKTPRKGLLSLVDNTSSLNTNSQQRFSQQGFSSGGSGGVALKAEFSEEKIREMEEYLHSSGSEDGDGADGDQEEEENESSFDHGGGASAAASRDVGIGSVLETDEGRSDAGDVWIHEMNH
jgi:hypothetical protein